MVASYKEETPGRKKNNRHCACVAVLKRHAQPQGGAPLRFWYQYQQQTQHIFAISCLFPWSAVCCYLTGHSSKQCKHQDFQRPGSQWIHGNVVCNYNFVICTVKYTHLCIRHGVQTSSTQYAAQGTVHQLKQLWRSPSSNTLTGKAKGKENQSDFPPKSVRISCTKQGEHAITANSRRWGLATTWSPSSQQKWKVSISRACSRGFHSQSFHSYNFVSSSCQTRIVQQHSARRCRSDSRFLK
jgi:hypothetical protein